MESADETTNNNGPCFDVPQIFHGHWPKNNKLSKNKTMGQYPKTKPTFFASGYWNWPSLQGYPKQASPDARRLGCLRAAKARRVLFHGAVEAAMFGWQSEAPLNDNQANSIWTTNSSFISIIFYNYLYDICSNFYVWCLIIHIRT